MPQAETTGTTGVDIEWKPRLRREYLHRTRGTPKLQGLREFWALDRLISLDVNGNGFVDRLRDAAWSASESPLTKRAAEKLIEISSVGRPVLMLTGFPPMRPPPWARKDVHSDGVIGSACLGFALMKLNGTVPVLAMDKGLGRFGAAALSAAGFAGKVASAKDIPEFSRREKNEGTVVELDISANQKTQASNLIGILSPSAVLAIEKPGMNDARRYHRFNGEDITDLVAKADYIFDEASNRGIPTFALQDIGNEVGMGNIQDVVREVLPNGKKCKCGCGQGIAAKTKSDFLVVGESSDWCTFGVIGAIAILKQRPDLIPTPRLIQEMLEGFGNMAKLDEASSLDTGDTSFASTVSMLGLLSEIVRRANSD